jgi:hypothetical protein
MTRPSSRLVHAQGTVIMSPRTGEYSLHSFMATDGRGCAGRASAVEVGGVATLAVCLGSGVTVATDAVRTLELTLRVCATFLTTTGAFTTRLL